MDCDITLSEAAIRRFQEVLGQEGRQAVRLSLRKAGCSGLEYVIEYADAPREGDLRRDFEGFTLFVDSESYPHLRGLRMDFQQDLLSSSFVFDNPNKKGECGCGLSFTV